LGREKRLYVKYFEYTNNTDYVYAYHIYYLIHLFIFNFEIVLTDNTKTTAGTVVFRVVHGMSNLIKVTMEDIAILMVIYLIVKASNKP